MPSAQLQVLIDMLRSNPPIESADIHRTRAGMEAMAGGMPTPEGTRVEPVSAGGVPSEWIAAADARADAAVLYLHGGGYCLGSLNTHRGHVARLSAVTAARCLAVDYRLAPEHPFPAAVDDAVAAYRWLLAQGVAPVRTVVAGDSAGGGLTVATLVALRDAGDPLPAGGVCLSPWIDLEGIGESMTTKAALDPMVQLAGLQRLAAAYLGDTHARTPLASPLYAELRGLPPLLVQVGTAETLLDDAIRLAARAQAAGVEVELEQWDDMIHVFQLFAPLLPEADEALARIGAWVRRRID